MFILKTICLVEGDSVVMDAEVTEYYDLTELKNISNLQVISSGNIPVINSVIQQLLIQKNLKVALLK